MKKLSISSICEKIWDLEKKFDLLSLEIGGVKVWQSLRVPVYHKISMGTGVFSQMHTSKESLFDVLKHFYYLYNVFFKNPLRGSYKKKFLIFDHPRKINVDGEYIDIYTDHLLKQLNKDEYDVIESVYLGEHLSRPEKNRLYLDAFSVGSFLASIIPPKFSDEEKKLIIKITDEIRSFSGVNIDLKKMFAGEIRHFQYGKKYYDKLIKKRRPEKIYLVVSYSFYKKPLIAAAKMNGVETVEIQHGTIGKYHLAYSFPGTDSSEIDYFPDTFYSFGKYWSDITDLPLKDEKIKYYGFPYFNDQVKKYSSVKRKPGQVLFISQGAVGKRLSQVAAEFALQYPGFNVIYKLHPGEYDRWRDDYPELVEASKLSNFSIVDNNDRHLYHYFAQSEYLAGVFSTAIYEGLAFGCKTVIVKLPGAEYMEKLIETGAVKSANDASELNDALLKPFENISDSGYFFSEGFK